MPRNSQKRGADSSHQNGPHAPVLQDEVMRVLRPQIGESYLDVTAGYGGHAEAVLQSTASPERAVLIDRDRQAKRYLQKKFGRLGAKVIRKDYLSASRELASAGEKYDIILADLGVSSPHLNDPQRGFSFLRPGPLDMRMDQRQELSAGQIVNQWPQNQLAGVIRRFGEEPRAKAIAKAIIANRPISDTGQLGRLVAGALRRRFTRRKIHPATRTFQALRIAVNDELEQLSNSLPVWEKLLTPGGRLAIISFHSLEDRIVKRYFAQHAQDTYDSDMRVLTKKPVMTRKTKTVFNPRARSAKLRAAVKIKI